MSFQILRTILPMPTTPRETVQMEQWQLFELVTGIVLPTDYKRYLSHFGTGIIGGIITPYNPFCTRRDYKAYYTCRDWIEEALAVQHLQQHFGPQMFPFSPYPTPDGVLPWGTTDNGDRLFWRCTGHPDAWTVVIQETHSSVFVLFEVSMSTFIVGILTGTIRTDLIPYDAIDHERLFETI